MQKSKGQRTQDGLRVLPADELQCPPAVRHEDGFVTDVAEIARPEAVEEFVDFIRCSGSHQSGRGSIGLLFIPVLHRFDESLPGPGRRRNAALVHRRHSPAAVLLLLRLRRLELIECPEYGKPTITFR